MTHGGKEFRLQSGSFNGRIAGLRQCGLAGSEFL